MHGLKINTQAIGEGIYQIITEKDEAAIVAFGMLPKWAMDMAERSTRETVIRRAAEQIHCTYEELLPNVDKAMLDRIVNDIMHEIALAIYKAASDQGKMIV